MYNYINVWSLWYRDIGEGTGCFWHPRNWRQPSPDNICGRLYVHRSIIWISGRSLHKKMVAGWWYISMEPCYPCWFVCPKTRMYAIALDLEHHRYFIIDTDINLDWFGAQQRMVGCLIGRFRKKCYSFCLLSSQNNISFSRLVIHTYTSTLTTIWLKSVTHAHTLP